LQRLAPRALGGLETGAMIVGPIIEAAMVGYDIYELVQSYDRQDKQVKGITDALDQLVAQGLMEKDGKSYKGPGYTIDVEQLKNMTAAAVEANWLRTGVDSAALVGTTATSILVVSGVAAPPGLAAGLVVSGVIITVHVGISVVEGSIDQHRRSEFLKAAPPWLLAMIPPEGLVGQSSEDVIREHTGVMRSEFLPRSWTEAGLTFNPLTGPFLTASRSMETLTMGKQREREKQGVREKTLSASAYRTFAAEHPDLVHELPRHGAVQELLADGGEFLGSGGDYEKIIRPLIVLQLQAAAHSPRALLDARNIDVQSIDALVLPDLQNVDLFALGLGVDDDVLKEAGRRAMLFYVHHRREQRYRTAIEGIESNALYDGEYKAFLMEQFHAEIERNKSSFYVFNVHPKTLPRTGSTLAERIIAAKTTGGLSGDVSSQDLAMMGYEAPKGQVSFRDFMNRYVEPQHMAQLEHWLENYATSHNNLPLSFMEMEAWGDDAAFNAKIAPTIRAFNRIDVSLSSLSKYETDVDLRSALERFNDEDIRLYLRCAEHKDFYNKYVGRWRRGEYFITGSASDIRTAANLQTLCAWKDRGYPTLIDERQFKESQSAVRRKTDRPFDFSSTTERYRLAERGLAGYVYDPKKPGRVILSYEAYRNALLPKSESVEIFEFLGNCPGLPGRMFDPFGVDARRKEAQRQRAAVDAFQRMRVQEEREQDLRFLDVSGLWQPLSSLRNVATSIAVDEAQMPLFMQSWVKNDGFDGLRERLLSSRILIVGDLPPERFERLQQGIDR